MPPRKYSQAKRSANAEETRRRIVEATIALHTENGIAATTIKQIAARADVGVGTVYHHFPTYDDVVRACGVRVYAVTRPPTPEIFNGVRSLRGRVERLVHELFAYYERYPGFERARCDRDKLQVLAEGLALREQSIEAVVREALRPRTQDEKFVRTTLALTDFSVYRALTSGGMSTEQAAKQVVDVLSTWLKQALRQAATRQRGVQSAG